jgi:N-acetyl-anhydromuramyl-L-alanine amidase AmpD
LREITLIVLHHSASSLNTTLEDIDKWHREDNGWSCCGYHFVIEAAGQLCLGRAIDRIGAHARGRNRCSIGICLVGDNTKRESKWTPAQIQVLTNLLHVLRVMFPKAKVVGHRDLPTASTECPGLDVQDLLEHIGEDHA